MPAAPAFRPRMLETRAASRLARHPARKKLEPRPSGRHPDKHKMGGARLLEHGWGGLSDLYEPYLLSKEMSGKNPDIFGDPAFSFCLIVCLSVACQAAVYSRVCFAVYL